MPHKSHSHASSANCGSNSVLEQKRRQSMQLLQQISYKCLGIEHVKCYAILWSVLWIGCKMPSVGEKPWSSTIDCGRALTSVRWDKCSESKYQPCPLQISAWQRLWERKSIEPSS